jgi:hypothetical protein
MHHKEALLTAAKIVDDRSKQYGSPDACFEIIARIATATMGEEYTPYDIAMILHCVKLGRMQEKRAYEDNYVDAMNYLAFAGQFAAGHVASEIGMKGVGLPGNTLSFTKKTKNVPVDLDALSDEILGPAE